MPSQKQLKWSQLKVGLTVLAASITLGVLIFLMSGTGGMFTHKIALKSFFDDANGLRTGAPVRLSGVDIGNVTKIRVVPDRQLTPVEVTMKVNTTYLSSLRRDSLTLLSTAGVLGETYINIDSSQAKGETVHDGDTLPSRNVPDFSDMVRSGQSTLQNMDALLKRLDRIIAFVESGQGSVGKLIYDPALYNRLNSTVTEFQKLVNEVTEGNGTIGKLISDDELYQKVNGTVDKLNAKLVKDPVLFNNANDTIANVKKLTDDINAGKGPIGKLAKDEQLAAKLENIINKLSMISDRLEAGEGSAGKLLRDPSLYNNADQMLLETRELLKSVRENPKKFLTIRLRVF